MRLIMDREKEVALLLECLALVRGKKPFMTDDEALIPVADYLDPQRFEEERRWFRSSMNIVARSSQVASPGDFITRDVVGTPTIVVRDASGTARAFVNVCRHRGATLELRQHGNCRRFVCPYHAWTYDTDGSLAAVRHPEGFPTLDLRATSLLELTCVEAAGLVWVCPDPAVEAWVPNDATQAVFEELTWLGCADLAVFESETSLWDANWKLIVDGGLEAYHFKIAHRNTIAGFFPDNVSTFEFIGEHIRSVLPRSSIVELEDQPQSEWDIRKHMHMLYSIAPNASILVQERHLELILMTPLAVDRTRIEIMTLGPKPGADAFDEKAKGYLAANHAFTKKTLDEDFSIAEQIQRGMHTGVNQHFRFARYEGALNRWHQRLDQRLGRAR